MSSQTDPTTRSILRPRRPLDQPDWTWAIVWTLLLMLGLAVILVVAALVPTGCAPAAMPVEFSEFHGEGGATITVRGTESGLQLSWLQVAHDDAAYTCGVLTSRAMVDGAELVSVGTWPGADDRCVAQYGINILFTAPDWFRASLDDLPEAGAE